MRSDAFSRYHPAVNFFFFLGAICFGVVIQHPAYLAASCLGGGIYYLLLHPQKGPQTIARMLPMVLIIAGVNPLFNTYGSRVLFHVFGRPYTLEALYYGFAIAGIFLSTMLWFGCYNVVLTSDKFTSLFGNLIPALSLLLVMVLRMIPNFIRKAQQITGCRRSIGKGGGEESSQKEKINSGMAVLSALTDWALEGSVVTGDSMRARGYGCAKRTSFQIYHMTPRDWITLGILCVLLVGVIAAGGLSASYTPVLSIPPVTWGFGAYCIYVCIPTFLHVREGLYWRFLLNRMPPA